jgi:hypothetical protein
MRFDQNRRVSGWGWQRVAKSSIRTPQAAIWDFPSARVALAAAKNCVEKRNGK